MYKGLLGIDETYLNQVYEKNYVGKKIVVDVKILIELINEFECHAMKF